MDTSIKRRFFLKGSVAVSALGVAVSAGLLTPRRALAAWSEKAFSAKKVPDALQALFATNSAEASSEINIKAPDIAENGAVVPVTITTEMSGVKQIAIIAENNPLPLVASFDLSDDCIPFVSTRIKMGKSGDITAVIKTAGKSYSARKPVKVTIGGCGG